MLTNKYCPKGLPYPLVLTAERSNAHEPATIDQSSADKTTRNNGYWIVPEPENKVGWGREVRVLRVLALQHESSTKVNIHSLSAFVSYSFPNFMVTSLCCVEITCGKIFLSLSIAWQPFRSHARMLPNTSNARRLCTFLRSKREQWPWKPSIPKDGQLCHAQYQMLLFLCI